MGKPGFESNSLVPDPTILAITLLYLYINCEGNYNNKQN